MSELWTKVILSYLLGSVVGSLLVGRLRGGVDIRKLGSGNAGGTNALRTQGKSFALWVLLIDVGKGFVASRVLATAWLPALAPSSPALSPWLPAACGMAAIAGHVYPVWYGFRGGKGVATLVGAVLGIRAGLLIPMLATWLAAVVLIGFVSVGSMLAAASFPLTVALGQIEPYEPLLTFGVVTTGLIVFTHRTNIARILVGREPRARRLWLLGSRK